MSRSPELDHGNTCFVNPLPGSERERRPGPGPEWSTSQETNPGDCTRRGVCVQVIECESRKSGGYNQLRFQRELVTR